MEGAEKILKCNRSIKVIMEFWPDGLRNVGTDPLELLAKLTEYGFKLKRINEQKQVLEPIQSTSEFCMRARPAEEFNLFLEK